MQKSPMNKVIVIGSPGAGKSTFSRKLRDKTGLPLYYLDMIFHRPDRTTVPKEEFDAKLREILEKDRWIIDGNYNRTMEMRMKACDTVFLLDYPLELCLEGAGSRVGTKREDLPWVEEELDEEFRQWIIDFPAEQLPHIYELVEKYRDAKEFHIFHSRDEAEEYLKNMDGNREMNQAEADNNKIRIIEYTEELIPDVLEFERQLRVEEDFWGWEIDDRYIRMVRESFHDPRFGNSLSLLAYLNNRVVGRIDAVRIPSYFDGSVKAYLDWICVLKSCRHKGAGQKLLSELRARLKAEGIDTLIALTASNEEAQRFYKSVPDSEMRDTGIWIDIK